MRIITVVTSITLMLTGIWCISNQGEFFVNIAFVLGCVMVAVGVLCMLIYFFAPGKQGGFGWFLAEGLITAILGGIVLYNQLVTDSMIPVFFGMWIMFCGVMRVVASLHLVMARNNSWIVNLLLGLISTAAGGYAFFNQTALGLSIIILTGIYFLIQGVNILAYGVFIPGKKRIIPSREPTPEPNEQK